MKKLKWFKPRRFRPGAPMPLKRMCGMVFMSVSVGMFVVIIIPGWGYIMAAGLLIGGFWLAFMC